ncbi:MAG: hypothetical protein WGN25_00950 [Candidatus Electrothrix sp. GW3-4]|uniref:hypothetical protein n=1 Tax=Candidatus Electrothrix sp. GW3-4 TaxID=3126740 RepID=UPI0030D4969D
MIFPKNLSERIGLVVFSLISISLGLISLTMIIVAICNIWNSIHEKQLLVKALLDAVGLIVIGMAVFDVSKFLLEEEVVKSHHAITPATQRATLSKFLVIISIAVSLEALVFIFDAGKKDITLLIYPTLLLIAAVLLIISLGVYRKLSQNDV